MPTPLRAVNVIGYVLAVPARGVPLSTPVAVLKDTPPGRTPASDKVGAGEPLAVIVNVPGVPTVNDVVDALVMAGACVMATVKKTVWRIPLPLPIPSTRTT